MNKTTTTTTITLGGNTQSLPLIAADTRTHLPLALSFFQAHFYFLNTTKRRRSPQSLSESLRQGGEVFSKCLLASGRFTSLYDLSIGRGRFHGHFWSFDLHFTLAQSLASRTRGTYTLVGALVQVGRGWRRGPPNKQARKAEGVV